MNPQDFPPPQYREMYNRAMTGRNRADAVWIFCVQCMGWSIEEAKQCESKTCPLHPYGPAAPASTEPKPERTPAQSKAYEAGKARLLLATEAKRRAQNAKP
jgi:hypothetical protein